MIKNIFLKSSYPNYKVDNYYELCIIKELKFDKGTETGIGVIASFKNNIFDKYDSAWFMKTTESFEVNEQITNTEIIYPIDAIYRYCYKTVVLLVSANFDDNMKTGISVTVMTDDMDILYVCSDILTACDRNSDILEFEKNLRNNKLKIASEIS